MARIIKPAAEAVPAPSWMISGEEVVTIALDSNEVLAVRNALREYHRRTMADTSMAPGSINASGARVFEALDPIVKTNGWI